MKKNDKQVCGTFLTAVCILVHWRCIAYRTSDLHTCHNNVISISVSVLAGGLALVIVRSVHDMGTAVVSGLVLAVSRVLIYGMAAAFPDSEDANRMLFIFPAALCDVVALAAMLSSLWLPSMSTSLTHDMSEEQHDGRPHRVHFNNRLQSVNLYHPLHDVSDGAFIDDAVNNEEQHDGRPHRVYFNNRQQSVNLFHPLHEVSDDALIDDAVNNEEQHDGRPYHVCCNHKQQFAN